MEQQRRRIDQILDPEFLGDIESIPIDDLRAKRRLCDDLDTELSYYRRMLHGKMDLLSFELRRRRGEEERTLLEALPDILAGGATTRTTTGRSLPVSAPDVPASGRRAVDRVLEGDFLVRLPSLSEDELETIQRELTEVETNVSAQRRDVYDVFERIQAELTRRYREGLADAGELIHHG